MAASVQVLCPNGRRQNVKITPNTKLLQVLEEVCKRQGFIPPEDYTLMHGSGRKHLDLSLSIRFAGLANNAKLELIKSSVSRQEEDVLIALQLETGTRIQGTFAPSKTLWDILLDLEEKNSEYKGQLVKAATNQDAGVQPVCIFMQEQTMGEPALKATTLKKLGLTSGKAIIRLLHRPVEDAIMANICEKIEKEKVKQTRLEEIAERKQTENIENKNKSDTQGKSLDQASSTTDTSLSDEALPDRQKSGQSQDVSNETSHRENERPPHNVSESSQVNREEEAMDEDGPGSSLSKPYVISRSSALDDDAHVTTSTQEAIGASHAIDDLRNLNIPGLEIFTPDDFNDLTPQEQALAQRLARRFIPHFQAVTVPTDPSIRPSSSQTARPKSDSQQSFLNFKFPEETKGKDLRSSQFDTSKEHDSKPCDRQLVIYNPTEHEDTSRDSADQELPADFFEVTQADVRKMYRDLQKAVKDRDEQPLMTKAMREIETQAICDRYEQVVIRVHFPDKLVLQAFFKPRETVETLHSFVRSCLQDKKLKFYLYTTPPRMVLENMDSSLAANDLCPAALVYFGSDLARNSYLEERLTSQIVSRQQAESVVAKVRPSNVERSESGSSISDISQPGPSYTQRQTATSGRMSSSSSSASASSGVPKWLKLGKK